MLFFSLLTGARAHSDDDDDGTDHLGHSAGSYHHHDDGAGVAWFFFIVLTLFVLALLCSSLYYWQDRVHYRTTRTVTTPGSAPVTTVTEYETLATKAAPRVRSLKNLTFDI